jgi:hypothetical protein
MRDLFYICKYPHRYTLRSYLTMAREEGDPTIHLLPYEKIARARSFRSEAMLPASYVFTDMDRATPVEVAAATVLAEQVRAKGPGYRVINDPTNVALRFELLRLLNLHGINDFNAYLLVEGQQPARWPVFVRSTRGERTGPSDLIHTPEELDAAVYKMTRAGIRRDMIMIVEFQETEQLNGAWVKYGAYYVAGNVLPAHVHVCTDWRAKLSSNSRVIDRETIELERQWLQAMRFKDVIARVFEIAGIEYGRVDFGISGGRPQFWEINTNPDLLTLPRAQRDQIARDPVMLPLYLPVLRQVIVDLAETVEQPAAAAVGA